MIGHQTVHPNLDPCLARLLGQQIAIDLVVAVLEEDGLSSIPALRHVVGGPAITKRARRVMGQINMKEDIEK
jgi:hypothetical protein